MKRIVLGIFISICAFTCVDAWAQATAQINGTARDQSGAVLPGVEIKATQTETGVTRDFTIDDQLRNDFEKAAAAHRAEVARTLRRCDAPLLSLRTDRDWIADVVRFVASRRRGALAGR